MPATPARPRSLTGAIRGLFRAATALLRRTDADEPKPQTRRRGETDKGAAAPLRALLRRVAKTGAATARGRYAALQPAPQEAQEPVVAPPCAYGRAALYLSDTLDWLNLWQDNAGQDHWLDDDFSAKQNQNILQP